METSDRDGDGGIDCEMSLIIVALFGEVVTHFCYGFLAGRSEVVGPCGFVLLASAAVSPPLLSE